MPKPQPHIRRARRTDFTAVMELLATSGVPVPPADRATLRRFRNLVNDLSGDFYLAFDGNLLVGLIHATYSRQLVTAPIVRVETLVVRAHQDDAAINLLAHIRDRAAGRGCGDLFAIRAAVSTVGDTVLATAGLAVGEQVFVARAAPSDLYQGREVEVPESVGPDLTSLSCGGKELKREPS